MRRIVIIFCLLLLIVPLTAQAQDNPPATTEPSIEALQAEAQAAVAEAQAAAAAARISTEDAERYASDASRFLGIFEAISVAIALAAAAFGLIGVTRLFSAQNELAKARETVERELTEIRMRFEAEMTSKSDELRELREEMVASVAQQRKMTTDATLALALLPVGERQYKAQDLQGAADTYERALALDRDNPLIHYRLGYVYVQNGQLEQAEHNLIHALKIDPKFLLAVAALGYVYRRMAEKLPVGIERDQLLNRSEAHLLKALREAPKLVDDDGEAWWGSLGGLYRRRGQIDQAIYAYEQAALVTPRSSYPFSNLALLYTAKGDRDAMLQTYKQVERLAWGETMADVDNFWAYSDLLTSRLALRKLDEAEIALESVLGSAPTGDSYALETLIDTLMRLHDALGGPVEAGYMLPYVEQIRDFIAQQNRTIAG